MKSFAVIGLGKFGSQLAKTLYASGKDVLAIDTDENAVRMLADSVTKAVVANIGNLSVLKTLGVDKCDCAIVAFSDDLAASVLATMNLKKLGIKKIICKAHDMTHSEIVSKLGADEVIIPEHVVADKLARTLTAHNLLEYLDLSNDYSIAECQTPRAWIGKSIMELNIRAKYNVNVIAIRTGEVLDVSPMAKTVFLQDSEIVVLGTNDAIAKIEAMKH
ncbi:MAG: TrkA family potassium uptake protein [Oscillospiraceae bacterium]|nr:TrkA family potassium uptake protein [Oscillospiraceae bacterium]